jgi:hypothetical protein
LADSAVFTPVCLQPVFMLNSATSAIDDNRDAFFIELKFFVEGWMK